MPNAYRPILEATSVSESTAHLWTLARRYGFHPRNTVGNQGIAEEFNARINRFVHENLLRDSAADRPWNSLKTILIVEGGRRRGRLPWDRREILHNWNVNELTLAAAASFLFNSYYRLCEAGVLERLKAELVWLLKKFGYELDSEHALFCPNQDWQKGSLGPIWRLIRAADQSSLAHVPDQKEIEQLIVSCEECPLRLTAVP